MAAKTTKTKKSKAISLAEFRAWLSGVEELQHIIPVWSLEYPML